MHQNTPHTASAIRISLIYREPLLEAGLRFTLESQPSFEVGATTMGELHAHALQRHADVCDVIVADYENGVEIQRLRAAELATSRSRIMIVTWRDGEAEIRDAMARGVHGYLLIGCPVMELISGVRAVFEGRRHLGSVVAERLAESLSHDRLTDRETVVLRLVAQGFTNKVVANQLDIGVATVKAHVKSIFAKFGATSRTEATAVAQRRGLLQHGTHADAVPMRSGAVPGAAWSSAQASSRM